MGYPMAQNLRLKLPPSDTLIVYDIRTEVVDRFATEEKEEGRGSKVVGAKALGEIMDTAVGRLFPSFVPWLLCRILWPPLGG